MVDSEDTCTHGFMLTPRSILKACNSLYLFMVGKFVSSKTRGVDYSSHRVVICISNRVQHI